MWGEKWRGGEGKGRERKEEGSREGEGGMGEERIGEEGRGGARGRLRARG